MSHQTFSCLALEFNIWLPIFNNSKVLTLSISTFLLNSGLSLRDWSALITSTQYFSMVPEDPPSIYVPNTPHTPLTVMIRWKSFIREWIISDDRWWSKKHNCKAISHHLGFNYPFGPKLTPGVIDTMITSPPKLRLETVSLNHNLSPSSYTADFLIIISFLFPHSHLFTACKCW